VIITGGENLYPVQIENFLREHEAIKDAAVIGIPDQRLGEIARRHRTQAGSPLHRRGNPGVLLVPAALQTAAAHHLRCGAAQSHRQDRKTQTSGKYCGGGIVATR